MKTINLKTKAMSLLLSIVMLIGMMTMSAYAAEGEHVHQWHSSWSVDADSHWHICIAGDGCTEKGEYAAHDWDEYYTISCNTCFYSQPHTHTGGTATCSSQATCELCGFLYGDTDPNIHKPNSWTPIDADSHKITCKCGTTITESEAHDFVDWGDVPYCIMCGYENQDDAHTHDWGGWEPNEDGTHTRTCMVDETHTETGTCAEYVYAMADEQNHSILCECMDVLGTEAHTMGEWFLDGEVERRDCTAACDYFEERSIEHTHDWGGWEPNEDGTHTRTCITDETHTETETCAEYVYAMVDEQNHSILCECMYVLGTEAHTMGEWFLDGEVERRDCTAACDYFEERSIEHTHDWGEWTFNGDGTHTRTCKTDSDHTETGNCDKIEWLSDANLHTGIWSCEVCEGGYDKKGLEFPQHAYSNETDLTCDTCGYVRTVEGVLSITGSMPDATVGEAYSVTFGYTGTVSGIVFWNATGLPDGLTVNYGTGTISGTPTTAGTYNVTVSMGATGGGSAAKDFTLNVNEPKHTHSYTSVVTAPTCTEQGYTTYTCECNDSYVSDYVDALGHSWGIRQRNETYHEEYCPGCGETGMQGMHTYGDDNICDGCGYTTHVHSWEIRQYNESHHEEYCPGCGETGMRGMHTYGDDGICTACGHAEHNHTWEYRIVNESRHEPYCPGCGETGLQGMHTWKYVPYGINTHQEVCTVCEYKGEKLRHENHNPDEDWLCDLCGANTCKHEERTPATCVSGQICKTCGYNNDFRDPGNHVGYTCDSPGICACGAATNHRANPYHTGGTEIRNAKVATEFEPGYTGDTYCLGCGDKLQSGEYTKATGFVYEKTVDGKVVGTVTVVPPDGMELPEDAKLIVKDHTATLAPIAGMFVATDEPEYVEIPENNISRFEDQANAYMINGYTLGEIIVINGEKYMVCNINNRNYMNDVVVQLIRLSDEATFYYDTQSSTLSSGSIPYDVEIQTNRTIVINGTKYDVLAIIDYKSIEHYVLCVGGVQVGLYIPSGNMASFYVGYDPATLAAQRNKSFLGTVTVTIPEINQHSETREELVADVEAAEKAIEDYQSSFALDGSVPAAPDKLIRALYEAKSALAKFDAKEQLTTGKTYDVYGAVAQDISLNGWNEGYINYLPMNSMVTGTDSGRIDPNTLLDQLKADMDATKAALDQLDENDPSYPEAYEAWENAKIVYQFALTVLTDNQKATVTQTFEVPVELIGNENVRYVAVHDTNPYAGALAEAVRKLNEGYTLERERGYLDSQDRYDDWAATYGSGAQFGELSISDDGRYLTANYAVSDFSPFIVYAFVEVDEPEIKTLSATIHTEHTGGTATCTEKAVCEVCGESYGELAASHNYENGTCTVCRDTEQVVAPSTSDNTIWYILIAIAAGAVITVSAVYGNRKKIKVN